MRLRANAWMRFYERAASTHPGVVRSLVGSGGKRSLMVEAHRTLGSRLGASGPRSLVSIQSTTRREDAEGREDRVAGEYDVRNEGRQTGQARRPRSLRRLALLSPKANRIIRLYSRCFGRIRVAGQRSVPALIQVDCRNSTPRASVRRISHACAGVRKGDVIELLTTDIAAVVAALSWCNDMGTWIERMESGPKAFVLDIATGRVSLP